MQGMPVFVRTESPAKMPLGHMRFAVYLMALLQMWLWTCCPSARMHFLGSLRGAASIRGSHSAPLCCAGRAAAGRAGLRRAAGGGAGEAAGCCARRPSEPQQPGEGWGRARRRGLAGAGSGEGLLNLGCGAPGFQRQPQQYEGAPNKQEELLCHYVGIS